MRSPDGWEGRPCDNPRASQRDVHPACSLRAHGSSRALSPGRSERLEMQATCRNSGRHGPRTCGAGGQAGQTEESHAGP